MEFHLTEFHFCFCSQTALTEFRRLCNPLPSTHKTQYLTSLSGMTVGTTRRMLAACAIERQQSWTHCTAGDVCKCGTENAYLPHGGPCQCIWDPGTRMFNGKFPFAPTHMALNFFLPGISHMGIPGKFPRFGNFPTFGNFLSRGSFLNSRPIGNSLFLSAHILDFQTILCIRKLVLLDF